MQKPNIKNLIRIHGFPESSVTAVRVQITNINVIKIEKVKNISLNLGKVIEKE